jgi:DHA1 family bicyclomycin/chloramphenicol resistance-like MFS transporter
MMIFIIVPIFAPALGGLILVVSGWRAIFGAMVAFALGLTIWFALRMPETLKPEHRQPISLGAMAEAFRRTATTRVAIGYSTCMAIMFGCVMGYINSAQQIFETEVYGLGRLFPLAFGSIAAVMGVASFLNARLVARIGMRRLAHGGAIGFTIMAFIQFALAWVHGGHPPLVMFSLTMAGCHFLFALVAPNANAMAMEPMGDIAGTASSFMGFYTTLLGALFGYAIGQAFDGTVIPLALGYFILGGATVAVMLWTEKGVLLRPHPSRAGH